MPPTAKPPYGTLLGWCSPCRGVSVSALLVGSPTHRGSLGVSLLVRYHTHRSVPDGILLFSGCVYVWVWMWSSHQGFMVVPSSYGALFIGTSGQCPPTWMLFPSGFRFSALLVWYLPHRFVQGGSGAHSGEWLVGCPPHREFIVVPSSSDAFLVGSSSRCCPCVVPSFSWRSLHCTLHRMLSSS